MRKRSIRRRGAAWEIILAGALLFALIWASTRASAASESHETVTEGYKGPERVKLSEKPVTPNSETTAKSGWIGDKRIDLRVVRKNEYTETRGWVDGEYTRVRETNEKSQKD